MPSSDDTAMKPPPSVMVSLVNALMVSVTLPVYVCTSPAPRRTLMALSVMAMRVIWLSSIHPSSHFEKAL